MGIVTTIYLLGICVLLVQGAVLKTEDAVIKSPGHCGECEAKAGRPVPPPLPLPPGIPPFPVFHTKQWSGLTRSHSGLNQGLFSGAAAGIDGGVQTGSQAFSLASTAVGADAGAESVTPEKSSYNKDEKFSDNFGQSSGGAGVFNGHNGGFGGLEKFSEGKGSFKESHFSYQSEGDKQFASQKGLGFQAGGGYGHHHFFTHGHHDHGGFGQNDQTQAGFGAGASSANSSFAENGSNGRDTDFGSARHFENENSGYRDQNAHYSKLNSGSGYGAHGKGFEISGNEQQKQQLQMGSQNGHIEGSGSGQGGAGYIHGSGSEWGGHFENGGSKYGSQNAHHGHFTLNSGYGKGSEISGNKQQLQVGSQLAGSGSGQEGTGYEHGSGFESAEHSESGGSKHGSQNVHHGEFISGSGYGAHGNSGFSGNEQQQQQKQLQIGSQNSHESGSGSGHEGVVLGTVSSSSQNGGSASNGYGSKQQEELQTGLSGALKLASEGLQQAQQQQSGCSTCDKSSYALSNAKSHSGSAIALSVAG